jgi:hypothetical protein
MSPASKGSGKPNHHFPRTVERLLIGSVLVGVVSGAGIVALKGAESATQVKINDYNLDQTHPRAHRTAPDDITTLTEAKDAQQTINFEKGYETSLEVFIAVSAGAAALSLVAGAGANTPNRRPEE